MDINNVTLTVPLDLLSVVPSPPPPPSTTPQQALLGVRDLFADENPGLFEGWNDTVSECEYPGVECNDAGQVTSVVLEDVMSTEDGVEAVGVIESILEQAPMLEVLVITNANIQGDIPTEWPDSLEVCRRGWRGRRQGGWKCIYV